MNAHLRNPHPVKAGVEIERVRVVSCFSRTKCDEDGKSAQDRGRLAPAQSEDHRIIVEELCIASEAPLNEIEARWLGEDVAFELGAWLARTQQRRLEALFEGRDTGGVVRVGELRIHLRGERTARPSARAIARELCHALEGRLWA